MIAVAIAIAVTALVVGGLGLLLYRASTQRGDARVATLKAMQRADAEARATEGHRKALDSAQAELARRAKIEHDQGAELRAAQDDRARLLEVIAGFPQSCPRCGADISDAADEVVLEHLESVGFVAERES